jgi:hypothetical protein
MSWGYLWKCIPAQHWFGPMLLGCSLLLKRTSCSGSKQWIRDISVPILQVNGTRILGLVLQEKNLVVVLILRIRFDYGMILTNPDQKLRIKCKLTLTILVTLFSNIWNLVAVPKVRSKEKPRSKNQISLIGTNDSYLGKRVPSRCWFCYGTMFGNKHV